MKKLRRWLRRLFMNRPMRNMMKEIIIEFHFHDLRGRGLIRKLLSMRKLLIYWPKRRIAKKA